MNWLENLNGRQLCQIIGAARKINLNIKKMKDHTIVKKLLNDEIPLFPLLKYTQVPELCLEAVKRTPGAIRYVKHQTPEMCWIAISKDPEYLRFIEYQTPELCMAAIRHKDSGLSFQWVKEQTPELCLEAVKQRSYALRDVKEQTPELCLIAVRKDGDALKDVREQTLELCLEALRQDRNNIRYVDATLIIPLIEAEIKRRQPCQKPS